MDQTGVEHESGDFSKLVMARHFWVQACDRQQVSRFDFVHSRLREFSDFDLRRGDILETARSTSREGSVKIAT